MSDASELTPAQTAQLSLLVEVASDPKPGNVDRRHDHDDTTLLGFVGSAVGVFPSLRRARNSRTSLGEVFEDAVESAQWHSQGNTHFGALLLLVPLVAASYRRDEDDESLRDAAVRVVEATTVEDAVEFYGAFRHVDVNVGDENPTDLPDVGDPDAAERLRKDGVSMYDVMEVSAEVDDVAREWVSRFERSFEAADTIDEIYDETRDVDEAVSRTYLRLLSERRDSLVVKKHGEKIAEDVRQRASETLEGEVSVEEFDEELIDEGINPGATADITSSGVYISLRRGGLRL